MDVRTRTHDLPPLRCAADVEILHNPVVERTLYAHAAAQNVTQVAGARR